MKKHANSRGFTLAELMIVIVIMGILASIAIPRYMNYIERAHATACLVGRGDTDKIITLYYNENHGTSLASLSQLVGTGYMDSQPQCPYGGEYVLIPTDENQDYLRVGCSLHYWPAENEPLTSLGSTFEEIIGSMMALIKEFYEKNGRYPRSWGDYAYTDIGIEKTDWTTGYNGIIYSPVGNSIKVTPEEGYTFYVTGSKGKEKKLKSSYNWFLWYSMEDEKWYYKKIKSKNEIDISTLRVVIQGKKGA